MKYAALIGAAALIALALWWGAAREKEMPRAVAIEPSVSVRMSDTGYSTTTIAIRQGEAVSFVNESARDRWPASDLHPTHEIYPAFDPRQPLSPGKSWQFRFDRCGTWRFHDHLAPNIRGSVEVICAP